jgi:hypothetical protein
MPSIATPRILFLCATIKQACKPYISIKKTSF